MRRGGRWTTMTGGLLAVGMLLGTGHDADAQYRDRGRHSDRHHGERHDHRHDGPGGAFHLNFTVADAVGPFGTLVDQGYGLEAGVGLPIAADGHLRLRGDVGFSVYGLERLEYCGFTCRVSSTVTTTNSILYGGVGPEIVFGSGRVRPYVHGSAGISWFVTSSSLDDNDGYGPYLETTNYSDAVFTWRAGGGMRFALGGGRTFIDLGVTRHDNQLARYLTKGDILDHPDGTVTLFPNESDADLLAFKVGVAIRLR